MERLTVQKSTVAKSLSETVTPASYSLQDACRLGGWGYTKGRELAQAGSFPVPVIRVGRVYRVPKAPLHKLLGIEP